MKRWEYQMRWMFAEKTGDETTQTDNMEIFGRQGWELVSVLEADGGYKYFWKRELPDDQV